MVFPVLVVGTMSATRLAFLLVTYGPVILAVAQQASGMYTDRATRRAAQAQGNAAHAHARAADAHRQAAENASRMFDQYRDQITPREVRIPTGAFNSSAVFTEAFVAAAIVTFLVEIHQGVQALKKIGLNLEDMHKELQTHSLAKIQGWDEKGYGYEIHSLLKRKIHNKQNSEDKHMFYVYNPDTVWYTNFEQHLENEPLPDSFGGYSADLDAIFLLMWTNRRTLIKRDEEAGQKAVFHLLVPTYQPYAVNDRLIIGQGLGPLVIEGDYYGSRCLTYFRFYQTSNDVILNGVGNLHDLNEDKIDKLIGGLPTPVKYLLGIVGLLIADEEPGGLAMFAGILGGEIYLKWKESTIPPIRVLGPPTFQEPQTEPLT